MNRVKELVKRVLRHFHILPSPSAPEAQAEKPGEKTTPDFNITTRKKPVVIAKPGRYRPELDDGQAPKFAFQVHAFFPEVMDEIAEILNAMPYAYDCYVSTDTEEKKREIETLLKENCRPHGLRVDVMENRGRDVGPFLQQMRPVIGKYEYIAHLHTKKSKHTDFGDDWRHFLYRNVFGNRDYMLAVFDRFEENETLGVVVPEVYPIVRELMAWDNTKEDVRSVLGRMGLSCELPDVPMCPVGDIFWARTKAVKKLFDLGYTQRDFQEEAGQLNYTLAHVMERIWCYLAQAQGYDYDVCINAMPCEESKIKHKKRICFYSMLEKPDRTQIYMIRRIKEAVSKLVLLVPASGSCPDELRAEADEAVFCGDAGTNLEMWADAVMQRERELPQYEEIVLADDSLIGPLCDLKAALHCMRPEPDELTGVFGTKLSRAGFGLIGLRGKRTAKELSMLLRGDPAIERPYVAESAYIGEWLFTEDPVDELAYDFVILNAPFIKKESMRHIRPNERILLNEYMEQTGLSKDPGFRME